MIIQENLLRQAQMLDEKYKSEETKLTRKDLCKQFKITESQARDLKTLLDNPHLIKQSPQKIMDTVDLNGIVLPDIHCPYHDKDAVELALHYGESINANLIILLGDQNDFYQISSFVKDPEKRCVNDEVLEMRDFLRDVRKRFPKARMIYKLGNHDERLEKYIFTQAPGIAGLLEHLLQEKLELEKLNIEFMPNFFKIGKLWFLHGHELYTKNKGGMVNICDFVFRSVYDHFVCGHFHQSHSKSFKQIDKNIYSTYSLGWLANEEAAEYAPLNKYSQGFGAVHFDASGNFQFENLKIYEGTVYR